MLRPGDQLQARYAIVDLIDHGGMSIVFQASDGRLGQRRVAIKEMNPAKLPEADKEWAVTAFRQEAQVLARLNHPGIAAVTDFFEEGGFWYLVMEHVQGETLEKAIQRAGRFEEKQALAWTDQLVDMLSYLHRQNPPIIFRDLKPSNIILRPDGSLKLIDFGIARFFKPWKGHDTVQLGTPGYAAPEQYGQGQTDIRSDVYSLGVLLNQMLTGYNPSLTPLNLPPVQQLNPDVSTRVASAISQATQVSPEARFQSVNAFANALGLHETAPSPARRRLPLVPIIAAVVILAAAGALLLWRAWQGQEPGGATTEAQGSTAAPVQDTLTTSMAPTEPSSVLDAENVSAAVIDTETPTAEPELVLGPATHVSPSPGPTDTVEPTPWPPLMTPDPTLQARLEAIYLANLPFARPNDPAVFAYRVENPIQVDGSLAEWAGYPAYPVTALVDDPSHYQGESDLSSTMMLAWDDNFLYIAVRRVDDRLGRMGAGAYLYRGDSLEIQFDADLAGDFAVDDFDADDSQLGVSPGDFTSMPPETHQWLPSSRSGSIPGAPVAAVQTTAGYDIEFAIPWPALGTAPGDGAAYGFTLCTNDNDRLDEADQETMLCAHASRRWMVATSLGTLILATRRDS
jgi:serine/threonine-protein kinase